MQKTNKNGFTLIELLIVMAIIGLITVIVLVAINPLEQLSKAHDAGRISSVSQIGHQVQYYYTYREGVYPAAAQWDIDLVNSDVLASFPSGVNYIASNGVTNCVTNPRPSVTPNFCYSLDTIGSNGALVFAKLESKSQRAKCTGGEVPYFVHSTADGRGGVICSSGDPSPWAPGSKNYLD